MKDEYIRERWGWYFSWLMNEDNPRVETEDRAPNQGMTSQVSEAEIERALRGMKCGKAVGSDEIPVEVWKCLGQLGVVTLCKIANFENQQNDDHWVPTLNFWYMVKHM